MDKKVFLLITIIVGVLLIYVLVSTILWPFQSLFIELAKSTGIPFFCEIITMDAEGISREHCYMELAVSSKNELFCKALPQPPGYYSYSESQCYINVARIKKDLSLCVKIKGNLEDRETSECFSVVAREVKDSSTCDKIHGFGKKEQWERLECYSWVSSFTGNFLDCEKLENREDKEHCYLEIINVYGKDVSVCDKITFPKNKDICFRYIGQNTGDVFICDKISDQQEDDKNTCYSAVAWKIKNPSLCEKISTQYRRDSCYYKFSECEKIIVEQELKDLCYKDLAMANRDSRRCDNIVSQEYKDSCYGHVACDILDESICREIQDQKRQEFCFSCIANRKKD